MKWTITYFDQTTFKKIDALPKMLKARYAALTERMETHGPDLGMPHTKALSRGLFEIRIKGQEGIARVFYCTQVGNEIIMLHSFIKKTQQTPKKEMDIARQRLQEVKNNG